MGKRIIKLGAPLRNTKISKRQKSQPSAAPPWTDLPLELTENILQRLSAVDILGSAEKVCSTWREVCRNRSLWRVITIIRNYRWRPHYCRRAVDRSQGVLTHLTLAYFGDDDLLDYIVDRSSHLRSLTLAFSEISEAALIDSVKKLPELEELHLFDSSICDIETIGISCPKLKSFTFSMCHFDPEKRWRLALRFDNNNSVAVAIAKSMPNLIHLGLIGNHLENEGLEAILDCCSHLESLDLRLCFNLEPGGPLLRRCEQQMKHVKLPRYPDISWKRNPFLHKLFFACMFNHLHFTGYRVNTNG